jgi:hypothetical protein
VKEGQVDGSTKVNNAGVSFVAASTALSNSEKGITEKKMERKRKSRWDK